MAEKPSDTHSIRKVREQAEQLSAVRKVEPFLRPLLSVAGVDTRALAQSLESAKEQQRKIDEMTYVVDRFNELFARRGWIVYGLLNADLAKSAVAAAEAGDMAGAEGVLVEHYNADEVDRQLNSLSSIRAFRPRMRLAKLALVDYREERYHACIPVVLALLDGMVNELGNLGFFSKDVDLAAWDSMAASDSGLKELHQLLFKTRSKTRTDAIDVPYRNGIHHGMDLGYDTRIVAAKCWAALFASSDWARKIEQGEKQAPPPEPEPTLLDALAKVQRNQQERTRLDAWAPRSDIDLVNPAEGSPEAALGEFLNAWKSKNYGAMARRLGAHDNRPLKMRAGEVRSYYEDSVLKEFTIQTVLDTAASASQVEAHGAGDQYGRAFNGVGTFRMVQLDEAFEPVIHGEPGGSWFVMIWNPWQHKPSKQEVVESSGEEPAS